MTHVWLVVAVIFTLYGVFGAVSAWLWWRRGWLWWRRGDNTVAAQPAPRGTASASSPGRVATIDHMGKITYMDVSGADDTAVVTAMADAIVRANAGRSRVPLRPATAMSELEAHMRNRLRSPKTPPKDWIH